MTRGIVVPLLAVGLAWAGMMFSALDMKMTEYVLVRGGREVNPVVRWAMERFGVERALVGSFILRFVILLGLGGWVAWTASVAGTVTLLICVAAMAYVATWNWMVVEGMR